VTRLDALTVRVFVSSTFLDMDAERDILVTAVFPELRERLARLGLEFFDVDLRWGVPETGEDGERANPWAYCKQWIDRVEPFFLCMLGQRYGSRLDDSDLSITAMEVNYALARRKRSLFYFRESLVPDSAGPALREKYVDLANQTRLHQLKETIVESGARYRDYACTWTDNGPTALDLFGQTVLEDLWSAVLQDERYVSRDAWQTLLGGAPATDPLYIRDVVLVRTCWEHLVALAKPVPSDPWEVEALEMERFANDRLRWFAGRTKELGVLRTFIDETLSANDSRICVIHAAPGSGKTALLAKLAHELAASTHVVISHFVGATERSADLRFLLERLVHEIDARGTSDAMELASSVDLDTLRMRLASRLEHYRRDRRLILIIDGLDALTTGRDLSWIPARLGEDVRIVLSFMADTDRIGGAEGVSAAIAQLVPPPRREPLGPLADADIRAIVTGFLAEYCKELDTSEHDAIARMSQAGNPLYLLVMLEELRKLGGHQMHVKVRDMIADFAVSYPDTISLFDWMLVRLEVFGADAALRWWSYLALGRTGMSGAELADLLGRTLGPDGSRAALRIERGVRHYLQRRGPQWDFFHWQLREAAERRYRPANPERFHADVASYFAERWRQGDRHAISELPYHQMAGESEDRRAVEQTLSDMSFIDAKCAAGLTYELLADFDAARALSRDTDQPSGHGQEMDSLQTVLRRVAQAVASQPRAVFSTIRHHGDDRVRMLCDRHVQDGSWKKPWIRTRPLPVPAVSGEENAPAGESRIAVEVQSRFRFGGRRVAALAGETGHAFYLKELGRIGIVNVASGREHDTTISIRPLRPLLLSVSADARRIAVAFDNGEIDVMDIDSQSGMSTSPHTVRYLVPEFEQPAVSWINGRLWYQPDRGTLAAIDQGGISGRVKLIPDCEGELRACIEIEGGVLAAVSRGDSAHLIEVAADGRVRHWPIGDLVSLAACGHAHVVCGLADYTVVVLDRQTMAIAFTVPVEELAVCITATDSVAMWGTDKGQLQRWRFGLMNQVESFEVSALLGFGERPLELVPVDAATLMVTGESAARFAAAQSADLRETTRIERIFISDTGDLVIAERRGQQLWVSDVAQGRQARIGEHFASSLLAIDEQRTIACGSSSGRVVSVPWNTFHPKEGSTGIGGIECVTPAVGGGFWLLDYRGGLHYLDLERLTVSDVRALDTSRARYMALLAWPGWLAVRGVGIVEDWQRHVGREDSQSEFLLFFRVGAERPPGLDGAGIRVFRKHEGFLQDVAFDPRVNQLAVLTHRANDPMVQARFGTAEEFTRSAEHVHDVAISGWVEQIAIGGATPSRAWLWRQGGGLALVDGSHKDPLAVLATEGPVNALAAGINGVIALVESETRLYWCEIFPGENR
jgi:hypothetical protein